ATALARLGSDSGAVLEYVLTLGMAQKKLAERDDYDPWTMSDRVLVDMMKLHERFPDSQHVHRLLLASAIFATNRELAEQALALPVPKSGGHPLVREHIRARHSAALVWGNAIPEDVVDADTSPVTAREIARLRLDGDAIVARTSASAASWIELVNR